MATTNTTANSGYGSGYSRSDYSAGEASHTSYSAKQRERVQHEHDNNYSGNNNTNDNDVNFTETTTETTPEPTEITTFSEETPSTAIDLSYFDTEIENTIPEIDDRPPVNVNVVNDEDEENKKNSIPLEKTEELPQITPISVDYSSTTQMLENEAEDNLANAIAQAEPKVSYPILNDDLYEKVSEDTSIVYSTNAKSGNDINTAIDNFFDNIAQNKPTKTQILNVRDPYTNEVVASYSVSVSGFITKNNVKVDVTGANGTKAGSFEINLGNGKMTINDRDGYRTTGTFNAGDNPIGVMQSMASKMAAKGGGWSENDTDRLNASMRDDGILTVDDINKVIGKTLGGNIELEKIGRDRQAIRNSQEYKDYKTASEAYNKKIEEMNRAPNGSTTQTNAAREAMQLKETVDKTYFEYLEKHGDDAASVTDTDGIGMGNVEDFQKAERLVEAYNRRIEDERRRMAEATTAEATETSEATPTETTTETEAETAATPEIAETVGETENAETEEEQPILNAIEEEEDLLKRKKSHEGKDTKDRDLFQRDANGNHTSDDEGNAMDTVEHVFDHMAESGLIGAEEGAEFVSIMENLMNDENISWDEVREQMTPYVDRMTESWEAFKEDPSVRGLLETVGNFIDFLKAGRTSFFSTKAGQIVSLVKSVISGLVKTALAAMGIAGNTAAAAGVLGKSVIAFIKNHIDTELHNAGFTDIDIDVDGYDPKFKVDENLTVDQLDAMRSIDKDKTEGTKEYNMGLGQKTAATSDERVKVIKSLYPKSKVIRIFTSSLTNRGK